MAGAIGPADQFKFNDVSMVSHAPDGSVVVSTGDDGFPGAEFTLTTEGDILVDGVSVLTPQAPEPEAPAALVWIAPQLLNGFSNFGDTANYKQSTAGYRKNAAGTHVELTGLVKGSANTNIFNLPAGYRPANQKAFTVVCAVNNDTLGTVKIQPNGNVFLATGLPGAVFLTGIEFPLD